MSVRTCIRRHEAKYICNNYKYMYYMYKKCKYITSSTSKNVLKYKCNHVCKYLSTSATEKNWSQIISTWNLSAVCNWCVKLLIIIVIHYMYYVTAHLLTVWQCINEITLQSIQNFPIYKNCIFKPLHIMVPSGKCVEFVAK